MALKPGWACGIDDQHYPSPHHNPDDTDYCDMCAAPIIRVEWMGHAGNLVWILRPHITEWP